MGNRYYWLKFREDFFNSKRIKKLRAMAGGDTYLVIYLKMQLISLKTGGVLEFTGVESEFADELALDLDEKPDDVRVTLLFLLQYGLCECSDNVHYFLPWVAENTGSEGDSAKRWRDWKKRQDETPLLDSNASLTERKQIANVEKEIEKEKEKEKESSRRGRFTPPSLEEVKAYCNERNNSVDPQTFIDFYTAKDWMIGKNKMRDWRAAVRTWERNRSERKKQNPALKYEQKKIRDQDFNALVVDWRNIE